MNKPSSTEGHLPSETSKTLMKAFPLSAITLAVPLLVLSGIAKADGIERDSGRERFRDSVNNFYSWMPAVKAADCPAGKHWAVAANGGIAVCVGNPAPVTPGGGGDSGYYGDGGGDSGGDSGGGGAGGSDGCGDSGGGCDAGGGADGDGGGGGGDGGGGGGDGGGGGGDGGGGGGDGG